MSTQQYYQSGPPQPPAHINPMKNGLGTGSLVLGILSIVFAWVPFLGFGSYITSIVGLVTGVYGRKRAKLNFASNEGVATAGIVTSAIGLAFVIFATIAYSSLLYAAGNEAAKSMASAQPTTAVEATEPSEATTSEPAKDEEDKPAPLPGVGDKVRDGDLQSTVKRVEDGVSKVGSQFLEEKAQGQFVIVTVRVKNVGSQAVTFLTDEQLLFDKKGREYESDGEAIIMGNGGDNWIEEINPGNATTVKVIFDVPKKVNPKEIEFHSGLFSDGARVSLS